MLIWVRASSNLSSLIRQTTLHWKPVSFFGNSCTTKKEKEFKCCSSFEQEWVILAIQWQTFIHPVYDLKSVKRLRYDVYLVLKHIHYFCHFFNLYTVDFLFFASTQFGDSPFFVSNYENMKLRGPKYCCNFIQFTTYCKKKNYNKIHEKFFSQLKADIHYLHQIREFKIIKACKVISCQPLLA